MYTVGLNITLRFKLNKSAIGDICYCKQGLYNLIAWSLETNSQLNICEFWKSHLWQREMLNQIQRIKINIISWPWQSVLTFNVPPSTLCLACDYLGQTIQQKQINLHTDWSWKRQQGIKVSIWLLDSQTIFKSHCKHMMMSHSHILLYSQFS